MLPVPLAEKIVELADSPDVLPSERAVLKMTASMILYNRLGYTRLSKIKDPRIRLTQEEMLWMPGTMEVLHGLAIPKHWETPEQLATAAEEDRKEAELELQGFSLDEVWKFLDIRDELEAGTIYSHPLTGEEMTDVMAVFNSWKENKTLHPRDPQ